MKDVSDSKIQSNTFFATFQQVTNFQRIEQRQHKTYKQNLTQKKQFMTTQI